MVHHLVIFLGVVCLIDLLLGVAPGCLEPETYRP